jgi:hypothetical protein
MLRFVVCRATATLRSSLVSSSVLVHSASSPIRVIRAPMADTVAVEPAAKRQCIATPPSSGGDDASTTTTTTTTTTAIEAGDCNHTTTPTAATSSSLTAEQLERMERNRLAALERRKLAQQQQQQQLSPQRYNYSTSTTPPIGSPIGSPTRQPSSPSKDQPSTPVRASYATKNLISELIEPTWREQLQQEFTKSYFAEIENVLALQASSTIPIYPPRASVFAAMNACAFDKVKVVILGQGMATWPYQCTNQPLLACVLIGRLL